MLLPLTHKVSNENLGASLDGIVEGSVEGGVLDLGVYVHLHTEEEYDCLHVLFEYS